MYSELHIVLRNANRHFALQNGMLLLKECAIAMHETKQSPSDVAPGVEICCLLTFVHVCFMCIHNV